MMKLLTFSTLFPNLERPSHGIFVETRLRHLVASGQVQSRVVAPVPWFPLAHACFGTYGRFARVPRSEVRSGIEVLHPRYALLPKIGMTPAPLLMAMAVKPVLRRLIDEGFDFDAIDAHYFYPDGVAAAMLGKEFGKPVVITARGSDITLLPQYRWPGKMIRWAAGQAAGIITVCNALREELLVLGADPAKVVSLRNGVDLQLFRPVDRTAVRQALGITGLTLLSVGNLVPVKGHELTIGALTELPEARLLIAGSGPEREHLQTLATQLQVADRVSFLGSQSQDQLRDYYNAADIMVLSSSREGWANVLLESMACGTPVVASKVWGTPEVVAHADAGLLMEQRSAHGIAEAVRALLAAPPSRQATRRYAEGFSWDATTAGQLDLFGRITGRRH